MSSPSVASGCAGSSRGGGLYRRAWCAVQGEHRRDRLSNLDHPVMPHIAMCALRSPLVGSVFASKLSLANASPNALMCASASARSKFGTLRDRLLVSRARLLDLIWRDSPSCLASLRRGDRALLVFRGCVRVVPDLELRLDLVDERLALRRGQRLVQLVQRRRPLVDLADAVDSLRDRRSRSWPGRTCRRRRRRRARAARSSRRRAPAASSRACRLRFFDRGLLLRRRVELIEAHRDEHREPAVVMMAVVLLEIGVDSSSSMPCRPARVEPPRHRRSRRRARWSPACCHRNRARHSSRWAEPE